MGLHLLRLFPVDTARRLRLPSFSKFRQISLFPRAMIDTSPAFRLPSTYRNFVKIPFAPFWICHRSTYLSGFRLTVGRNHRFSYPPFFFCRRFFHGTFVNPCRRSALLFSFSFLRIRNAFCLPVSSFVILL